MNELTNILKITNTDITDLYKFTDINIYWGVDECFDDYNNDYIASIDFEEAHDLINKIASVKDYEIIADHYGGEFKGYNNIEELLKDNYTVEELQQELKVELFAYYTNKANEIKKYIK